jgi:elongation factor Ts
MTKISAAEVNKLRKMTGSGMMDCKNALVEAEGDFDKAIDILRKKGQKVAAKRGDREAAEGVVLADVTADKKTGILVALNCETDFVAKNEEFVNVANNILKVALENKPATVEELKALKYPGTDLTIAEKITEEIGKIGEKIDISAYEIVNADTVVAYNHPGNKLATIVGFNKEGDKIEEIGKQVAMQVAAMNPIAINEEGVPADIIEKEMAIGREQALQEGKPENIVDKIAEGKVKKYLKENTLLNQAFIRDNKLTVEQFLSQSENGLTVTEFKRVMIGG